MEWAENAAGGGEWFALFGQDAARGGAGGVYTDSSQRQGGAGIVPSSYQSSMAS